MWHELKSAWWLLVAVVALPVTFLPGDWKITQCVCDYVLGRLLQDEH